MKLGFVGLGRMGAKMVAGLASKHEIVGFDADPAQRENARRLGARCVEKLEDLPGLLSRPRVVWLMVPMGRAVDEVIAALAPHLENGDVVVDGGNADFLDSRRRRAELEKKGVGFAGAGTSGGLEGAFKGPPITVDCSREAYAKILPILESLGGNHSYFPEPGKGHLAKTIHNAIEYGMMQSLAEGVALYARHGFSETEIRAVFKTWERGSIIESRLVQCLNAALAAHSLADPVSIKKSETTAIVQGVLRPDTRTPIIAKSADLRNAPLEQDTIALTVLARLRSAFGGHQTSAAPK